MRDLVPLETEGRPLWGLRRAAPRAPMAERPATLSSVPLLPRDEPARLADLREFAILDSGTDDDSDALVQLAATVCGTSMAALTFVDADREWYKARVGIDAPEVPRHAGLCSRAIVASEPVLEVGDTALVPWFDPMLHGPRSLPVRFYAGVPLRTRDGSAIGTLCVMDSGPRSLSPAQREALQRLARTACTQLTLRRQLRLATQTDRLTGLPNWLHFEAQFEASRPRKGVVCFVRLRTLTQIGSAHGFRVADAMVLQTAERLRTIAREGAFIGRIKRGLFVLFFPELEADDFALRHAPLVSTQLQAPYSLGDLTLVCPVHLGFAAYPRDGATLDEAVNAADAALQMAIERDEPAAFFDRTVDSAANTHYRLEPQLRAALAQNQFVNYYQPKVDMATGHVVGVEALIRWVHPQRGLVPPSEFVPALEATGLVREVGWRILERAVMDWRAWRDAGLAAPRIAVNVAAAQLRDAAFAQHLRDALAPVGGDPTALGLEVTESVLIGNMEQASALLREVRALGIPVAIDDFGTGYSSLAYIVTLPVDEVKIDRSFVAKVSSDAAYRGIVGTCITLARNLNLRVVAEGVETHEQVRELLALQCSCAQGFLYSPPVPADDIARLLARGGPLGREG